MLSRCWWRLADCSTAGNPWYYNGVRKNDCGAKWNLCYTGQHTALHTNAIFMAFLSMVLKSRIYSLGWIQNYSEGEIWWRGCLQTLGNWLALCIILLWFWTVGHAHFEWFECSSSILFLRCKSRNLSILLRHEACRKCRSIDLLRQLTCLLSLNDPECLPLALPSHGVSLLRMPCICYYKTIWILRVFPNQVTYCWLAITWSCMRSWYWMIWKIYNCLKLFIFHLCQLMLIFSSKECGFLFMSKAQAEAIY